MSRSKKERAEFLARKAAQQAAWGKAHTIERVCSVTGEIVRIKTNTVQGRQEYKAAQAKVVARHTRPKTKQTVTQKAFAYQSSAEFVSESLHAGGAQRSNKDSISPRRSHGTLQATGKLHNLRRQLAASEKEQKEREQDQAKRERLALVAERCAQGLAEVVVGCVVTLCYIDENETVSYYVLSKKKEYRGKFCEYVENYDTPPYGADECLRADADLAKVLLKAFVGDEVEVSVADGVLKCRVVSVTNHIGDKPNETATTPHREMSEGQTHARIGSEAYAFLARDNGSFGSFVSHDDYSDEADAEVHGAEAYENERELADDYD